MQTTLFFAVFSIAVSQAYGNIVSGKCANVEVKPFDVDNYIGKWYEIYRYDYIFERSLTCKHSSHLFILIYL
jgi:lipocalin